MVLQGEGRDMIFAGGALCWSFQNRRLTREKYVQRTTRYS